MNGSTKPTSKLLRFARILWLGILLVNLFVIGLVVLVLAQNRQRAIDNATTIAKNYAHTLDENFVGFIRRIDITLLTTADEVARQKASGGIKDKELKSFLARQDAHIPEARGLRVMDIHGNIRYAVNGVNIRGANIGDRPYFIRVRDDPKAGLVFSEPVMGRASNVTVITLSRRINNPEGSFAGEVNVAVATEQFANMLSKLYLGSNGSASLWSKTSLIARHPIIGSQNASTESAIFSSDLRSSIDTGKTAGTYRKHSVVDGVLRTYAFHQVGDSPLYLVVGLAEEDYLAEWRKNSIRIAGLVGVFVLGSLAFLWLLSSAWKRQIVITEKLAHEKEKFHTVADYTYDWEYWQGINREILFMSPSCERITGYSPAEFHADPDLLFRIIHPEDQHLMTAHLHAIPYEDESRVDFRIMRKDGEIRWIAHGCRAMFGRDGNFMGRRASNRDISERKLLEVNLKRQAHVDYLTGVSNRGYFMEVAELEINRAVRYDKQLSLLMLDIDHFKRINDRRGHKAGDTVLVKLAEVCRQTLREVDIIGRVGGEEFVILMPETDQAGAIEVAERLRLALAKTKVPMESGLPISVTVSIGVASLACKEENMDVLLSKADHALYEAKEKGRNKVCVAMQ